MIKEDVGKEYDWSDKMILIVEDDLVSKEFLEALFEPTNVQLVMVDRGSEAIELFKSREHFDCVLMDIRLPDINGFEVTKKCKEINNSTPIIAQTAFAMEDDKSKCISAGCDDYVSKPIDKDILFEKIDRLFRQA